MPPLPTAAKPSPSRTTSRSLVSIYLSLPDQSRGSSKDKEVAAVCQREQANVVSWWQERYCSYLFVARCRVHHQARSRSLICTDSHEPYSLPLGAVSSMAAIVGSGVLLRRMQPPPPPPLRRLGRCCFSSDSRSLPCK